MSKEHTWYEGYRLSYPDRPPVPERHDWDGLKVKQTFYIVRVPSSSSLGLPAYSSSVLTG